MNYSAANRWGINWSCSEIRDFHYNCQFDRSKLRGITPIAIKLRMNQSLIAFDDLQKLTGYSPPPDIEWRLKDQGRQ